MTSKNILEAAKGYIAEGLALFPLKKGQKCPLPGSQGFYDATVVEKSVIDMFTDSENNIAIATGMKSAINGLLLVVDIDEKNGVSGSASLAILEEELGKLPQTRTVKTPSGGLHLYFYCKIPISCATAIRPGIDIRGEGGYVVAPPSQLSGFENPYEWQNNELIAELPKKWVEFLAGRNQSKNKKHDKLNNNHEIPKGSRNTELFHYACQLQRKGMSEGEALTLVTQKSEQCCNPPLPLSEVKHIVTGVYQRYDKKPEYRIVSFSSLLNEDLPSRECIVDPWLPRQGLAMIYAPRGIGKTYLTLWVAYYIATGKDFLGWKISKPCKVLYIDGEMSATAIKQRCEEIRKADPCHSAEVSLDFLTPDLQPEGMPDISTKEGQHALEPYLADVDLVIIDSISTLCRQGDENKAEDWLLVQEWALRLRALGKSVLFIHHAGKAGQQRGTSKREDVLDTVLSLKNPAGFNPSDGASFEIHFEKSRGFFGDDARARHAQLITDAQGRQQWAVSALEESTYQKVIELHKKGLDQKEISEKLEKNKSTICRYLKRAQTAGLLEDDSEEF